MNNLYIAMSCLQGRPMQMSFDDLISLPCKGIQLTPGNVPTKDFEKHVKVSNRPYLKHHGFSFAAYRKKVWDPYGNCLVSSDSVHPPKIKNSTQTFILEDYNGPVLESMYPSYYLGDGESLSKAMELNIPLAIDVSHLKIQLDAGVLDKTTLKKVFDYKNIKEVHISESKNGRDTHDPINCNTFGLGWVKEKSQDGVITVLECYMHQLNVSEREEQLKFIYQ